MDIHTHPTVGVYVDNLLDVPVKDFKDVEKLVAQGGRNKHTAATSMNARSSRSHTIFCFNFEVRHASSGEPNRMATVQVVDLAGRESESSSESRGERLQELKFINQSLFHLAKCINALSAGTVDHIPFRDSKLTLLLSESFQHNSWTCILATLTPSADHFDENLLTCRFLESTGRITTHPVLNKFSGPELQAQLQREISEMQEQLQMGELGSVNPLIRSTQLLLEKMNTRTLEIQDGRESGVKKKTSIAEASRQAGNMLDGAAALLDKVDEANRVAVAALDLADVRLAAVERRVEKIRGTSLQHSGLSARGQAPEPGERPPSGVPKLPPLAPVITGVQVVPPSVSFSVELPPIVYL